jgi:hypothetical protein
MLIVGLAFCIDARHEREAVLNAASVPRIWSPSSERNRRNAGAHGGNVLADIQVIEDMEGEDPAKAETWKGAFARLYSLDFAAFHFPLVYAPPEIIKVCDFLATIPLVRPWSPQSSASQEGIKRKCQKILKAWMDSIDVGDDFYLSSELRKDYNSVSNWYQNVGSKKPGA